MQAHDEALEALDALVHAGRWAEVEVAALETIGRRWSTAEGSDDLAGRGVAEALSDAIAAGAEVGELVELGLTGEELAAMVERVERWVGLRELAFA